MAYRRLAYPRDDFPGLFSYKDTSEDVGEAFRKDQEDFPTTIQERTTVFQPTI